MYSFDYKTFKRFNPFVKNKDMAEYLEVSEGYISKVISGQTQLSEEKFTKLINHPTWDISALMMSARDNAPTYEHPINLPPVPIKGGIVEIKGMKEQAESGGDLPTQITDVESVVAEEVPYLERPIIESRDSNIREYVESEDVKTIIPQGLICTGIDFARKIYSDAMAPDIREGDIILCNFVPDTSNLVDGDIYVVETTTYGCVMRDIKHDGDEIILMARNGRSPDLRVKQSEIKSVAVPIQLIRSTFSQRTDYSKMLREKDERIGLLVEREFDHIRHTDKLLEQIDKVTNLHGKIVDALIEKVK